MPIKDYEHEAKTTEEKFFSRNDVSDKNKEYVKKFLINWTTREGDKVKPSRKSIFFKHIYHLLKNTTDIKRDMIDSDKIENIFSNLNKELSISYYGTVVNVSYTLVRKLNNGETPKGFKNIKRVSKKKQKRYTDNVSFWEWEEIEKLSNQSKTIQMKAIPLVQGDGGFRPSEFYDLNYGSLRIEKPFVIASVDGKTGKRDVILFRSVPSLLRWYNAHPTKKSSDPLWILENDSKSHRVDKKKILRYSYPAMAKRLKELAKKAGINKPADFYTLRHSACRLAKNDNIPLDEASSKFGHSVKFFTEVYGQLSSNDKLGRMKKHYGLGNKEEQKEIPIECGVCSTMNEPNTKLCSNCGNPLNIKDALAMKSNNEKETEELKKKQEEMEQNIKKLNDTLKGLIKKLK